MATATKDKPKDQIESKAGDPPDQRTHKGAFALAVWRKEMTSKDGRSYTSDNLSLQRGYKDKDNQWVNKSLSFDGREVSDIIALLQEYERNTIKRG